ncbi:MAG: NEAT domain-containing protein [Bacillota bacterium]|nr:NEAT domain-containing protein [Bacillota bacterium]
MKKLLKITLALMMALGLQLTSLNAVSALNIDLSKAGTYQIPVKNLKSAAPIPAVQTAFANAFGDSLEVTVDKDGKMQAVATLQNMIINIGKEYYANVLTISNGTTLSTKVEKATQGMAGETVEVEVPEKISFELPQLDENNSTVLPITVDFMNAFMGNGKDYPTNVTLTLDLENAKELQKEYTLEDGTYDVPVNVLKENSDDQSMAAQAVESAQVTVKNNEVVVTLKLKEMTIYGQTASVDKMEYQLKDGIYKEATVIEEENGHPTKVQFKLDENTELTNVRFYYGGSQRGASARLQLKLDGLTKVDPTPETPKNDNDKKEDGNKKEEEVITRFSKDGTYEVNVALWNATSDKESMAADALNNKAKIIVKDGKATMYISTKEMTFGTIKASLQEFYIGNSSSDYKNHSATIIEKDVQRSPTLWAFELPHENEYIDVMMNPHVAMMGNMDLGARIKVDYTTLTYVSNQTELKTTTENNQKVNDPVEKTNSKDQTTNNNQTNENKVVKTGDETAINMMVMLMVISLVMIGVILRKKHEA